MKVITVKRYKCDFCNKSKSDKKSIAKHEPHCFKNPNRVCYCGVKATESFEKYTDGCRACDCYNDYLRRIEGDYDNHDETERHDLGYRSEIITY